MTRENDNAVIIPMPERPDPLRDQSVPLNEVDEAELRKSMRNHPTGNALLETSDMPANTIRANRGKHLAMRVLRLVKRDTPDQY